MEAPPDYEEKPNIDTEDLYKEEKPNGYVETEDLYNSTEGPTERLGGTLSHESLPSEVERKTLFESYVRPECGDCGTKFFRWSSLAAHEPLCQGRLQYFCKICNVSLKKAEIKAHTQSSFHRVAKAANQVEQSMSSNSLPSVAQKPVKNGPRILGKPPRVVEKRKVPSAVEIKASVSMNDGKRHCVIQPWEKAAGAQNAEDILLGVGPRCYEEEVKKEPSPEVEETAEKKKTPPGKRYQKVEVPARRMIYKLRPYKPEFEKEPSPEALDVVNMKKGAKLMHGYKIVEIPSRRLYYEESDEMSFGPLQRCPCPVRECGDGFLLFSQLKEHVAQTHSHLDPLWCELCPETYQESFKFWIHMEKDHGVSKPKSNPEGYSCYHCGKSYIMASNYYEHRVKWQERPHFRCCEMEIDEENREEHENSKTHTRLADPEPVPCEDCGREFMFWRTCRSHAEGYGGKPHRFCKPCNMTVWEADWEKHERLREHRLKTTQATRANPKECEDCGMKFLSANAYINHCDRYPGPHFRCVPCGKTVEGKEAEHVMTHTHRVRTGEAVEILTRWGCPVPGCEAAFQFESRLIDHMDLHPGELASWCKKCPEKFEKNKDLHKHMRKVHG